MIWYLGEVLEYMLYISWKKSASKSGSFTWMYEACEKADTTLCAEWVM